MNQSTRIAIALSVVVAVLAVFVHPYIDGPDSALRSHHQNRVLVGPLAFGLAQFSSLTVLHASVPESVSAEPAGPALFDLLCTRLC